MTDGMRDPEGAAGRADLVSDQAPGQAPRGVEPGAPSQRHDIGIALRKVAFGLVASLLLTGASFWAAATPQVYGPAVPVLLAALAIGQMGVHLVFFLHVSSGPEATNNIVALAFGIFVVALVVFGSMFIMANLGGAGMGDSPRAADAAPTTRPPTPH
jgi:cytochrome o ubiquinol oxidase operon protein cyoD